MSPDVTSRIARRRREAGIKREQLAKHTGIPKSRIDRTEQGLRVPRIDELARIAIVLDCSIAELLQDEWIEWTQDDGPLKPTRVVRWGQPPQLYDKFLVRARLADDG